MIALSACTTARSGLGSIQLPKEKDRPTPTGGYWKGVRHIDLLDALENKLLSELYRTWDWRIHVWYDNLRAAMAFKVCKVPSEVVQWFGVAASNGGDKALTFYSGYEWEETPYVHSSWQGGRYTTGFDLEHEARLAVGAWEAEVQEIPARLTAIRKHKLEKSDYDFLLLQLGRGGVVPWSKIGRVDREYLPEGKTLWDIYKAGARIVALTSGPNQPDNLLALSKLCWDYHQDKEGVVRRCSRS